MARVFAGLGLVFAIIGILLYAATSVSEVILLAPFVIAILLSIAVFVMVNDKRYR
ncbi:MAG: hypothetical protein Q4C74_07855 [Rothia sp. (in: high G+C Gram-positive bacteria)]|nr:hypothetical protein [Rothia sp. (in: high G+C Gram-positive bacteria)]